MDRFKPQYAILTLVGVVIVAAWSYLIYLHLQMTTQPMASMWMPPTDLFAWRSTDFALVYLMWAIMMAAMMLPSAIPMIMAFTRVCRQRNNKSPCLSALFSAAYLLIWVGFSFVLTLMQWQMHGLGWLSPMMDNQNSIVSASIFFIAGLYQFMPIKNVCLTHCKTPMGFLLNEWREGVLGGLMMGLKHGLNCLGCCWAQMLIMFAVGVMNLLGMVLITLLVIIEKNSALDAKVSCKLIGVLLIGWGMLQLKSVF